MTTRRALKLLIGAAVLVAAYPLVKRIVPPAPGVQAVLQREARPGATVSEVTQILDRHGWKHDGLVTLGPRNRVLTAWISNAAFDLSTGFPSAVDVIMEFVFDEAGLLKHFNVRQQRVSL
jgi:hypothetical protein